MKMLKFSERATEKVYHYYIRKVRKLGRGLPEDAKEDIVMEINSHIYEACQRVDKSNNISVEQLIDILDRLGEPEDILKPILSEQKLKQATTTFNPMHVIKALTLNLSNGFMYIVFSILYLTLFLFLFVIGAKLIYPDEVGLFFKNGSFYLLGIIAPESRAEQNVDEILGNWFIPAMILITTLLYVAITLILKLLRWKRK